VPEQQHQSTDDQHRHGQGGLVDVLQQRHVGEQQARHETHRRDREGSRHQAHQQIKRQVGGMTLLKALQQRQSRRSGEPGANPQEGVLEQVGQQDQPHQGKPEAGAGGGGRHQMGATDAGPRQKNSRADALPQTHRRRTGRIGRHGHIRTECSLKLSVLDKLSTVARRHGRFHGRRPHRPQTEPAVRSDRC